MKKLLVIVFLICQNAFSQGVPVSNAKAQYFDSSGNPLASGKLYSYISGTSTPLFTYADSSCGVPAQNANPVILDAAGRANVWLCAGTYRLVLQNSLGVQIWDVSGVPGNTGAAGYVTGTGTTNRIPLWTGTTAQGNSALNQASSVSINSAAASFTIGTSSAPTPLTTGGLVIAIGSGGKFIASDAVPTNAIQSLLEFYKTGTKSIINSTAASSGTVAPIDFQFAEVTAIELPILGGMDFSAGTPAISAASHGRIKYNSSTNHFEVSENGGAYVSLGGSSGWTLGSGLIYSTTTTNTIVTGDTTSLVDLDSRYTGAVLQNINTTQKHNTILTFSNTAGVAPELDLIHSRGTHGSPTNVQSGDTLGILAFGGKNSDGINESGLITGAATANWTTAPTNNPTKISIWTVPVGSGIPVRRLDVMDTGQLIFDPTDALAAGLTAIAIHPAGNGIGFGTYEAITSDVGDDALEFYVQRSAVRTLTMTLDASDSSTQTGLSIYNQSGVQARVLLGDCTVAGGTHKCLYFN